MALRDGLAVGPKNEMDGANVDWVPPGFGEVDGCKVVKEVGAIVGDSVVSAGDELGASVNTAQCP